MGFLVYLLPFPRRFFKCSSFFISTFCGRQGAVLCDDFIKTDPYRAPLAPWFRDCNISRLMLFYFFLLIILMSTTHPQYLCLWRRKKTHIFVYFNPITEAKLVTATKLEVPQIEHFKTFSYSFTLK